LLSAESLKLLVLVRGDVVSESSCTKDAKGRYIVGAACPPPNVKDEPRRDLARGVPFLPKSFRNPFLHDSLELLGFCERQVVVALPADSTSNRRVRTPLPHSPKTLGDHVLRKRKDLGLHQWQLARLLGVWRSSLGSWEANHYEPTGSVRDRVIAWLGFDPCE
jgi:DNA-binding transcriptional regulator YiaG